MTPRFLIDRGTATISAALIAPLDGVWRLVEAAAFPAAVEQETVLAFVARRAAEMADTLPEMAGALERWPDWERIEAVSSPPRRIALAAPNPRDLGELEAAALKAGWRIAARITPERTDALGASGLLGLADLDVLALTARDPPRADEARAVAELAAMAGAVASRRDDLVAILCGAAIEHAGYFPMERVVYGPAPPSAGPSASGNELVRLLMDLAGQSGGARLAGAKGAAALATVLERTVELVDIGAAGSAWFRALPLPPDGPGAEEGALEGFILAGGSILPDGSADDDAGLDAVIAWSPLRLDRPTHRDRLRDLRTQPWREAAGDGALLRMAAARAGLARLDAVRIRLGGTPAERTGAPDLLVVAGGAFAPAPAPAVALALADTIRRPGMMQLAYDHARLLAPLGTLDAGERLALTADLAADLLLPLGSTLMLDSARPGREVGRLRVASSGATSDRLTLASGTLRVVELPAGASASVELEVRDGRLGQTRARRLGFQAAGGLAGLLLDTRGIPIRLPPRSERRREVMGKWQRSLWPGAE